ncbi:hypothetical protein E4198_23250 [Streptomyces sp. RKND-216]|nr:hypothetical protein E4198_23250 [Streptomyces sp. RKND-216]
METRTDLFRAVRSGTVRATARPLHVGRTLIVVQNDLTDDREPLLAQTTQTRSRCRRPRTVARPLTRRPVATVPRKQVT